MSELINEHPNETIELTIPVKLINTPRHSKGSLHMTFGDVGNEIYAPKSTEIPEADAEQEEDPREHIMSVLGCLGGGVEIQDRLTGETWFISFLDIASAYRPFQLERIEDADSEV